MSELKLFVGLFVFFLVVLSLIRTSRSKLERKLVGCTVIEIDQRGCMGELHMLRRIGEIVRVADQREFFPNAEPMRLAVCRTVAFGKSTDGAWYVPIDDGAFQPIPGGRGYTWSH